MQRRASKSKPSKLMDRRKQTPSDGLKIEVKKAEKPLSKNASPSPQLKRLKDTVTPTPKTPGAISHYVARNQLYIAYLALFLYATTHWIQTNTFPYLTRKLGVSPSTNGHLVSLFQGLQLAGSPLFGRYGDLHGGKKAMIGALIASFVSYVGLYLAFDVWTISISRIPLIWQHGFQAAQLLVTESLVILEHDDQPPVSAQQQSSRRSSKSSDRGTPRARVKPDPAVSSQRATHLGRLGMAYGLGMVCGPPIGGYIATHLSERVAALFSGVVALAGALLLFIILPSPLHANPGVRLTMQRMSLPTPSTTDYDDSLDDGNQSHAKTPTRLESTTSVQLLDWKALTRLLQFKAIRQVLGLRLATGLPIAVYESTLMNMSIHSFLWTPQQHGYLLSYIGVVSMISQGLLVGWVTSRFSVATLVSGCLTFNAVAFFCMTWAAYSSRTIFLMLVGLLVVIGSILNTVTLATLTRAAPASSAGLTLGYSNAITSGARLLGPSIAGAAFHWGGFAPVGMVAMLVNAYLAIVAGSLEAWYV